MQSLRASNERTYDASAARWGRRVSKRVVLSGGRGYRRRNERFARFLGLTADARVIEFGSGIGTLTLTLAALGCRMTATDVSQGELDLLRGNAETLALADRLEMERGDPASLPSDWQGTFDFAVTSSVLHHVEDPFEFVRSMARFVKPGDWCGGLEPNAASPVMRLIQEVGFWLPRYVLGDRAAEKNFHTSTAHRLHAYATRAGLQNVEVVKVDLFPRPLLSRLPFLHAVEDRLTSLRLVKPLCITLFWRGQKPGPSGDGRCRPRGYQFRAEGSPAVGV
ncbi:MAG: class I SAM-dependent methyltransferase [Dehalococcoidia bacterium]